MNRKQKLGYMAFGAGGPVVEARYEIVQGYKTTTGYSLRDSDLAAVMQIWTIRFDKPPHGLRVKNAVEYTLFNTELHIVARCSELIIVLWDGGKKIFADPLHFADRGRNRVTISYSYSPDFRQIESFIVNFRKGGGDFPNVGFMDVNIDGVCATKIADRWDVSQWEADVNVPAELHSVTVTWTLTNGIRGSRTFDSDSIHIQ